MRFDWKYNPANRDRKRQHDREYNAKRLKLSDDRGESKQNLSNEEFDQRIEQLNQEGVGNFDENLQNNRINQVFGMDDNNMFADQEDSGMGTQPAQAGAASSMSQAAAAFSSSAGGGGGGGSMRGAAPLPSGIVQERNRCQFKYKKQYHLKLTYDQLRYLRDPTGSRAYVQYPIFEFPWEYLGFYLTADEIKELITRYQMIKVEHVKVKLGNYTAILNFDVGQAIATVGNNNVGFRASIMKNMRGTRTGFYNTNPGVQINNIFWGIHAVTLPVALTETTTMAGLGASFLPRNYDLRFNHEFTPNANSTLGLPLQYNVHMWNWFSYFGQRRNVSMNEGSWHEQEHSPNCIISSRNFIQQAYQSQNLVNPGGYTNAIYIENFEAHGQARPKVNNTIASTTGERGLLPYISRQYPHRDVDTGVSTYNNTIPYGGTDVTYNFFNQLDINPALFEFNNDMLSNIRLDTNKYFEIHKPLKDTMMDTFAIALEPMMTSTGADNTFIQGWMQVVIEAECTISVHGAPSYHYQQGGSGSFPTQFPAPQNYNPIYQYRQVNTGPTGAALNTNVIHDYSTDIPIEGNSRYKPMTRFIDTTEIPSLVTTPPSIAMDPRVNVPQSDYQIITRSKAKVKVPVEIINETDESECEEMETQVQDNILQRLLKNKK